MAFTDHKISAFTHKISDLADQPNLPPDELKARFDSSPEELRVAHNALCEDAAALETRVNGHDTQINQIAMDKFPDDTITKANLHPDLVTELDAKATQTALSEEAAAREAETTARESADSELDARIDELNTSLGGYTRIETGFYTGNGTNQNIVDLPFAPKVLVIAPQGGGYTNMVLQGYACYNGSGTTCVLSGNRLTLVGTSLNSSSNRHYWLALV